LYPSAAEKAKNESLLLKIKAAIKTYKPDLFIYVERMDHSLRDNAGGGIRKSVCNVLGVNVLLQSLIVLTHSGSPPPEGTRGQLTYQEYFQQRAGILAFLHRQASLEARFKPTICLVENHHSCIKNSDGEPLLPNGIPWRLHVVSMIAAHKTLRQYDSILEHIDHPNLKDKDQILAMYGLGRSKIPPVTNLIEQLMAPHHPRDVPEDEKHILSVRDIEKMGGDPLAQKECMIRRKECIRQKAEEARLADEGLGNDMAMPAPEPHLPPSFDSPQTILHRYRYTQDQHEWIIYPQFSPPGRVLEHDDGIDGLIVERSMMLRSPRQYVGGLPFYCNAIIKQDKKTRAFQSELQLTSGLNMLPLIGDKMETTKLTLTLNAISVAAQSNENDMLYVLGAETKTKKVLGPYHKLILGLQTSLMPAQPVSLGGKFVVLKSTCDKVQVLF
jgi:hypothetical protein